MLWAMADQVRRENVGQEVHLRGLVEISNHCARQCAYCGLFAGNRQLPRYRMTLDEILACAHKAVALGYGTLVMQSGEDRGISAGWMADCIRQIKQQTPLAVTLSLGERDDDELRLWKQAGADRYLLRFETSDRGLYDLIHPPLAGRYSDRPAMLERLREMGYEIGSGVMVGIPGQTLHSLADDILVFSRMDLDMIGVGPFIAHPQTPLADGNWVRSLSAGEQVPATELMVYKVLALTRLACPQANLPATTALATINKTNGRELGLGRGANIIMPNLTPVKYRSMYEIYPDKACVNETAEACAGCLSRRIASIGRIIGRGPGGRRRQPCPK
jgi:biotin synthase